MIWVDDEAEAPGVQGLGATYNTFLVWANGDGYSPDNMCRHPYSGAYYKVLIDFTRVISCVRAG